MGIVITNETEGVIFLPQFIFVDGLNYFVYAENIIL